MNQHMEEIKWRIIYIILGWTVNFIIIYKYKTVIIKKLIETTEIKSFIYTEITEAFLSLIKFSIYLSLYISLPYIIYNLYYYLKSALFENEIIIIRRILRLLVILYSFCWILNFKIILPKLIKFFTTIEDKNNIIIEFNWRIIDFINIFSMILKFLIIIQILPFLIHYTLIYFSTLLKFNSFLNFLRKYIYFSIFLFLALITPPDFFSELFLGTFIIIFIELQIFLLFILKA